MASQIREQHLGRSHMGREQHHDTIVGVPAAHAVSRQWRPDELLDITGPAGFRVAGLQDRGLTAMNAFETCSSSGSHFRFHGIVGVPEVGSPGTASVAVGHDVRSRAISSCLRAASRCSVVRIARGPSTGSGLLEPHAAIRTSAMVRMDPRGASGVPSACENAGLEPAGPESADEGGDQDGVEHHAELGLRQL